MSRLRILTFGSLPPALGGTTTGGVATTHRALLDELALGVHGASPAAVIAPNVPAGGAREDLPYRVEPLCRAGGETEQIARLAAETDAGAVVVFHVTHRYAYDVDWRALGLRSLASIQSWHRITQRDATEARDTAARAQGALDRLDELVFPTRHTLDEGHALGLSYAGRCHVVPNPLEAIWKELLGRPGSERRGIACVAGLIPRKRGDLALRCAAALDMPIAMIGDGPEEESLRALARELGVDARFTGAIDTPQVADEMAAAELLVVPSLSESFGNVYVEAAACGTPVVGFGPTVREIGERLGRPIGVGVDPTAGADAVVAAAREALARPRDDAVPAAVAAEFSAGRFARGYVEALA